MVRVDPEKLQWMHQIDSLPCLLLGVLMALSVLVVGSLVEVEEIAEPQLELYCDQPVYLVEEMQD